MLPSAQDLTYLIATAEAGNITKAASHLGISQPSLSLAIQRLERDLETQLLERGPRGVRLTRAGRVLVQRSRELTEQWTQIRAQVNAAHTEVSGTISLGCHPSVAAYTLPGFIPDLVRRYPLLEIKFHHDLSRRITQRVIDGDLDLGLVINPVRYPDLIMHPLGTDEVGFWQAPGLDTVGRKICIANLDLLQSQSLLRKVQRREGRFGRIITSSELQVIAQLTAAGAGVGILPRRVADAFLGGTLRPLPGMPAFSDSLFLIFRAERKHLGSLRAVVEAIRQWRDS